MMKYYRSPRYKKAIKKSSKFLSDMLSLKKLVKNPAKATLNTLLNKGSNIDTKRKQKGMIKNKAQVYNNKTKRWVVINTKTGKFERQGSRKAVPYKNIRKL